MSNHCLPAVFVALLLAGCGAGTMSNDGIFQTYQDILVPPGIPSQALARCVFDDSINKLRIALGPEFDIVSDSSDYTIRATKSDDMGDTAVQTEVTVAIFFDKDTSGTVIAKPRIKVAIIRKKNGLRWLNEYAEEEATGLVADIQVALGLAVWSCKTTQSNTEISHENELPQ